jgi:hypothetical protein
VADTKVIPGHNQASGTSVDVNQLVEAAREIALPLAERVRRPGGAPVRATFVSLPFNPFRPSPVSPGELPALAKLLRGGRGGEVKLKTLLSALWIGVAEPHDVTLPGRVWAQLIGLPDPGGRGAHRVNSAVRQLVSQQFLRAEHRPGEPSRLYLLDETGNGQPYIDPGRRVVELQKAEEDFEFHRYFRVPRELWTGGWIAALSGPALAMLLVLLSLASGRDPLDLWFAPGVADRRFRLSAETRKRGLDRLRDEGLITVRRRPITNPLETTRLRNIYSLNLQALGSPRPPT